MTFKAKPCFNFQTIEFEFEVNTKEDWDRFIAAYSRCYHALQKIAPEDIKINGKKLKSIQIDPATDRQKEIMDEHGIDYPENISRKAASKLIQESMEKAKEDAAIIDDDDDGMPF